MIQVANLSKNYDTLQVLKDISFTVSDGEILGFLGPNGAGKTTTMKIITGYTAPSSGSVKVNGLEVSEHPIEVKRQIGYLPEAVPLYDDMSVLEYLKFIADIRWGAHGRHCEQSLQGGAKQSLMQTKKRLLRRFAPRNDTPKRQALKTVIQICGLQKMIQRPIGELSKGFRQRTCLAQALIHNPDILILDEPTSGLDPNQIAEIREVIKEIGKEKTVILSTHILQEVQAACDRVIIINEGKIVAQGTTEELERQAQGQQSIYVKMRGLKDKIHQLLLDLPQAQEVNHKDTENTEIFGFEIIVKGDDDIREPIFRKAVQADAPILEMRQEKASLEDVFRQLTQ